MVAAVRAASISLVLLSALLSACSGGSKGESKGDDQRDQGSTHTAPSLDLAKPLLAGDAPLAALTVASGKKDAPASPRPGFTSAEDAVTARVAVAVDPGSQGQLVVAWYRVATPDQPELLFSQAIEVKGPGQAFAEARSTRGLPPGAYETVAFFEGHQVRTPWIVKPAARAAAPAVAPGQPLARLSQPSSLDLEPGDAGYVPAEPLAPLQPGECRVEDVLGPRVIAFIIETGAEFDGDCPDAKLTGTINGVSRQLNSGDFVRAGYVMAYDICPWGSDLPGTVIEVTGSSGSASRTGSETVPDAGEAGPAVMFITEPPAGTKVEPGDRITIKALAFNVPPAYGIKTLYVSAGDELLEAATNKSGATEARPCDLGRLVAELETTYVVPRDPPAIVTILGESVDFLGRTGPFSVATASFPTVDAEVWRGELSGSLQSNGCSTTVQNGEMTLLVDREGNVTGTGTTTSGAYTCDNGATIPPITIEYAFTGKKADRFTLTFEDGVQLASDAIEGNRARMVQTTVGQVVIDLSCVSC